MRPLVEVPPNYVCPLCDIPDPESEYFWSRVLNTPICDGCDQTLSYLIENEERPDDPILDKLEALSQLGFFQYKRIILQEFIDDFEERMKPENVHTEAEIEIEATQRSLAEVVDGWKRLIQNWRNEIA
ncbi:MAG: hypothetical protein HYW57_01550, partial [Ignavibacteriales bacterium]|nr:hypothetical protein [Ignavibacteriales bacterium]